MVIAEISVKIHISRGRKVVLCLEAIANMIAQFGPLLMFTDPVIDSHNPDKSKTS